MAKFLKFLFQRIYSITDILELLSDPKCNSCFFFFSPPPLVPFRGFEQASPPNTYYKLCCSLCIVCVCVCIPVQLVKVSHSTLAKEKF